MSTWQKTADVAILGGGIPLSFHKVGYLFLAQKEDTWKDFLSSVRTQKRYNVPVEALLPGEIQRRWPYLNVADLKGGTFCPEDGYADPYEVTMAMANIARQKGVDIFEQTEVTGVLVDRGFMETVIEAACHRVPVLGSAEIAKGWGGLYTITPDGNPIIGADPNVKGFYNAIGFSGHGFQHGSTALDMTPFFSERFTQGPLLGEKRVV